MRKMFLTAVVLSLLILTSGCGTQKSPSQKPHHEAGRSETQVRINPELAERIKETAKTVKGVEDSTAVVINDEISTAVKVKGFNRLRLKSIREEVHRKIKETNKDYKVYVTSDKKLFAQLQQIEKQIKDQKVQSKADLQKRVKKIIKDMQG